MRKASLTEAAHDILEADVEIPVVSFEDVYGGKLVAALDRQHPRDLFDVMQLSNMKASRTAFAAPLWSISPATSGRCMRSCFLPLAISDMTSNVISKG